MSKPAVLALLFLPTLASAQATVYPPSLGNLVGKGGGAMNFECAPISEDRMRCDFVQILFSHDEAPAPTDDMLSEAMKDKNVVDEVICKMSYPLTHFFATGERTAMSGTDIDLFYSEVAADEPMFRRLAIESTEFCSNRTVENLRNVLDILSERERQSCRLMFNKYAQTFKKVSEQMWVVESDPSGTCGLINTSHFFLADPALPVWEYSASKIVKNKVGTTEMGLACSDLDESTILYTWRESIRTDCTFIK